MNPSSNETPSLNLPAPVPEQAPQGGEAHTQIPEALPVAETTPTAEVSSKAVATALNATPAPVTPVANSSDVSATTSSVANVTAKDSDLIEKAIVDKAKAIIEKTKDDPYEQTEQLAVFRGEHMGNEYNIELKAKPSSK